MGGGWIEHGNVLISTCRVLIFKAQRSLHSDQVVWAGFGVQTIGHRPIRASLTASDQKCNRDGAIVTSKKIKQEKKEKTNIKKKTNSIVVKKMRNKGK